MRIQYHLKIEFRVGKFDLRTKFFELDVNLSWKQFSFPIIQDSLPPVLQFRKRVNLSMEVYRLCYPEK